MNKTRKNLKNEVFFKIIVNILAVYIAIIFERNYHEKAIKMVFSSLADNYPSTVSSVGDNRLWIL